MKITVIILSDPKASSDEALGRLFNGLAATYDFQQAGADVALQFQGAATRWIPILESADHPAHELFRAVQTSVAGVSCGCADVFGARDAVERTGVDLIRDNPVPGTTGLPSLHRAVAEGRTILTF